MNENTTICDNQKILGEINYFYKIYKQPRTQSTM